MNAFIWVGIIAWVLLPTLWFYGACRAASRENPARPDDQAILEALNLANEDRQP